MVSLVVPLLLLTLVTYLPFRVLALQIVLWKPSGRINHWLSNCLVGIEAGNTYCNTIVRTMHSMSRQNGHVWNMGLRAGAKPFLPKTQILGRGLFLKAQRLREGQFVTRDPSRSPGGQLKSRD